MPTDKNPLRLGVMGWPVRQSRSPELFYRTFAGRNEVLERFSYDLLEDNDFKKAYGRFLCDYYAVNVTTPYKEPAFRAADESSAQCTAIGAANLLIKRNGRIIAHNTDVIAVTEILRQWIRERKAPVGPSRPKVLVVGCGGAGKAATVAALSTAVGVAIVNRTGETVLRFIDHLKHATTSHSPSHSESSDIRIPSFPLSALPDQVRLADFIIYTLPVSIPELELCDFEGKTVLEAKYYDSSIKKVPGMNYIPGTEWLRLQALATYRILGLITDTFKPADSSLSPL
ncbi:MAG: hypothetical protein KBS57_00450 [Alistipes sp.]|nr:hypothetical protein [Candidatus Minthomonas equi]